MAWNKSLLNVSSISAPLANCHIGQQACTEAGDQLVKSRVSGVRRPLRVRNQHLKEKTWWWQLGPHASRFSLQHFILFFFTKSH